MEKKEAKNQTQDTKNICLNRTVFTLGCVLIYFLAVGIIWSLHDFPHALWRMGEVKELNQARLVLYDGPESLQDATAEDLVVTTENNRDTTLKHCVDTQVMVNGNDCYVYDTNVNNTHSWVSTYTPALSRTPVTYFDFEGAVEIQITVPDIELSSVTVRPLAYGIEPVIDKEKHTVTFTVSDPDSYTVEFNGSVDRAVHIFANPLETDVPDFTDSNVKYIGPGEWNIDNIVLEDGQTLYISGGAVVHGIILANNVSDVKIQGRGILDGSTYAGWAGKNANVPLSFNNSKNFSLEGIISLNSNAWGLQAFNTDGGVIDGLKMITARPNGDGLSIQSCQNIEIKNCFIRTWDDSLVVKNYDSNSEHISFSNIQVWTDLAQSMEIGYETNKGNKPNSTISDITFEDITVLHNFHKSVVSIHNADNATVSGITYKNIVVEDASMGSGDGVNYLIDLQVLYNSGWSTTTDRGTISDVTIDGLTVVDGRDVIPSIIQGTDEAHGVKDVNIRDLTIKGQSVKSLEDGNFKIDDKTVSNVDIE